MPESDTWTGGVAMESMTSVGSAGSCDSVVSVNSMFSDDSLEHLSAEEKACLMFLEETIESLEAEEDSGLSTDEPEDRPARPKSLAAKMGLLPHRSQSQMDDVSDHPDIDPVREPGKDNSSIYLAPPPLALDNSNSSTLPKAEVGVEDGTDLLPTTPSCLANLPPDRVDLVQQPVSVTPDVDPHQGNRSTPSVASLLMIPPPTDFRDEPFEQQDLPEDNASLPKRPLSQIDMMQILKKSVSKDSSTTSDDDQFHNGSTPPSPSEALPPSPYDFSEPKNSPPAVAPKPKQLPSNILLKAKNRHIPNPLSSPDPNTTATHMTPSERYQMDPQRVRMEALRKLGLLRDNEAESGPQLPIGSPAFSPKLHRARVPSPSLVSPAYADLPQNDMHRDLPLLTPPPAMEAPEPKFFGEYRERSRSDLPTISRPSRIISPGGKSATLERTGSGLSYGTSASPGSDKGLSKPLGVDALTQLRNTRHRPASLGNGKDFIAMQGDPPQTAPPATAITKFPEFGDGVRPPQSSSSQKLPRAQGISVVITPRGQSGEDRREALRKLGLLKD